MFQPWVLEMNVLSAALWRVVGPGPWEQLYWLASLFVGAIGIWLALRTDFGDRRAIVVSVSATFANYYALGKYPGHLNVAITHWTAIGVAVDFVIAWRWSQHRPISARLTVTPGVLLVLALGQDLGYVAGISLTSAMITGSWILATELTRSRFSLRQLRDRAGRLARTLPSDARRQSGSLVALLALGVIAATALVPTVAGIASAARSFDFSRLSGGGEWWSSPVRLLVPVLPGLHSPSSRLLDDSSEGSFAASPGWFFVGAAALGLATGHRQWRAWAPAVVLLALFLSFRPSEMPHLKLLPWFEFVRVTSRFSVVYPLLLMLIAMAVPRGWFRGRRAVAMWCGLAILVLEASTAYWTALGAHRARRQVVDADFVAFMSEIRHTPGEAVLDWPFCVASADGTAAALLGPYCDRQIGIESQQAFHRKKVLGKVFGRLHPDQVRPLLNAGWDRLLRAGTPARGPGARQTRDFSVSEWAFLESFVRLNDLAGIILYPDLLPRETTAGFIVGSASPLPQLTDPGSAGWSSFRSRSRGVP